MRKFAHKQIDNTDWPFESKEFILKYKLTKNNEINHGKTRKIWIFHQYGRQESEEGSYESAPRSRRSLHNGIQL